MILTTQEPATLDHRSQKTTLKHWTYCLVILSTFHELFLQLSNFFLIFFSDETFYCLLVVSPLIQSSPVTLGLSFCWKTCEKVRGRTKSVGKLDVPAVMAPALCSFVLHHHWLHWCKVNVKRHLADGCFSSWKDVNRDILPLSFLFLWSLYKAPEAQEEARGDRNS